jgi:hypothetical protein
MRIVFTIPAPKELYMFKIVGDLLRKHGHEIFYLVRDYGPNKEIADNILTEYAIFGKKYFKKSIGKISEFLYNMSFPLKYLLKISPDLIVGDCLLGYPSKVMNIPSIAFIDGDPVGLYKILYNSLYLSDVFVTPKYNSWMSYKKKIIRYNGLQELVYLHPKYFRPDPKVLNFIGVSRKNNFVIIRLSALEMSHDVWLKSISSKQLQFIVNKLSQYFDVYISSEKKLENFFSKYLLRIPPHLFHSALYYSSLFISDTASAVEAALLGTPSIQISPVDHLYRPIFNQYSTFLYISKAGLMKIFSCTNINELLKILSYYSEDIENQKRLQRERAKYFIDQHIDVATFFAWFIHKYPVSLNLCLQSGSCDDVAMRLIEK